MKILNYIIIFAALGLWSCNSGGNEHGHDHEHESEHEHSEHAEGHEHKHGAGVNEIILEPEMAKRMGVETAKIQPGAFYEVIRVNGQIVTAPTEQAVAVAPSAGIVTLKSNVAVGNAVGAGAQIASIKMNETAGGNINETSRANIAAAKREVDRLKPLLAEGLVTTKEYNEALAAYESALTTYSPKAASGSVTSPMAGVISEVLVNQGQYVEAGQPIANISKNIKLTLRADLPEKYFPQLKNISSANFRQSGSDIVVSLAEFGGSLTSGSKMTTAQNGYFPIYFTFNNAGAIPGSYVEVYLKGAPRDNVIVVPVSALTEQQGEKYVYIKLDEEGYERRLVKTGGNDGRNVEILSGINSGDEVVTKGATIVRLAENSGAVPEGHTHNH